MTHHPPRVAVVDDEVDVATYLGFALSDQGYKVRSITEPATALSELRAFGPDLVCLDLVMPEQTGLSLYVAMRRDAVLRSVPVLILSGVNARAELAEALAATGESFPLPPYLEKPVEIPALLEQVERAVGHPAPEVSS